ncbi:MAG: rod shape-determining protein MreD [Neomegalonema sp.]
MLRTEATYGSNPSRVTRRFASWFWPMATGLLAIAVSLSPVNFDGSLMLTPHWLLAVLLFWTARRPASTPPMLVFGLTALHDLVSAGPIGLEMFAALICVEALRSVAAYRPHRSFAIEWARIAVILILFELIVRAMLTVTLAGAPDLSQTALRYGATVAVYPLVVLFLRGGFGMGRAADRWISL